MKSWCVSGRESGGSGHHWPERWILRQLKRKGFADARLAKLAGVREAEIRKLRDQYDLHPVYKRVDTCAAEFAQRHRLHVLHL
ncbi:hypothetical protein ACLK18_00225 [Escherichia coli]